MLPFCKLFLGFSKSNPTVITGQSVSAGRPRRNKNATYFIKIVGEFVCNVCGMQFMTKYALYDHNLGVFAMAVIRSSGTKRNWQTTIGHTSS